MIIQELISKESMLFFLILIHKWKSFKEEKRIEETFKEMGIDIRALKKDQGMEEVDDFDFICYVAYGAKPLTRKERAN